MAESSDTFACMDLSVCVRAQAHVYEQNYGIVCVCVRDLPAPRGIGRTFEEDVNQSGSSLGRGREQNPESGNERTKSKQRKTTTRLVFSMHSFPSYRCASLHPVMLIAVVSYTARTCVNSMISLPVLSTINEVGGMCKICRKKKIIQKRCRVREIFRFKFL